MSSPEEVVVDLAAWVDAAEGDPTLLLERQATEIFLTALGLSPFLATHLYLKGGLLMGIVYDSPRLTADLDLTTDLDPDTGVHQTIHSSLDEAFPRAAARLGHPDVLCLVQSVRRQPRRDLFEEADCPALKLTVGYARRGSNQAKRLAQRQSPQALQADISFREPVQSVQLVHLGANGSTIRAYSRIDLMAEKLRALLQQERRNRYRRQDVYDLALLLEKFELDDEDKAALLFAFVETCRARGIEPDATSLSDPEVARRARSEWESLRLELEHVPDFDPLFQTVAEFYRGLPWPEQN